MNTAKIQEFFYIVYTLLSLIKYYFGFEELKNVMEVTIYDKYK
jgi:hypothetical protein